MNLVRKILFPVSIIYWLVTFIRNWLYDKGVFKSTSFDVPVIAVGNLSVGGTGKTPQIEYLIDLLADTYKVAVLSRGYKRKSKGFVLADEQATAESIGDEPFQFFTKFKDKCLVAVDADRRNAINALMNLPNKPDVILLDDAFQHRKVKGGFYILLTAYNDLFVDDFILPFGNLREPSLGKKRADIVVVTKCPTNLDGLQQQNIIDKLQVECPVFFSSIVYDDFVYNNVSKINVEAIKNESKLLVAGIANPTPFFDYLQDKNDQLLTYPDHYFFTKNDCIKIAEKATTKKIVTTEKDFVRLNGLLPQNQLFYLPIKLKILKKSDFDTVIFNCINVNN
ncbi:tetraacyldisaccharide 4'-kinase [Flavobacterium sp. 20NA77.7]|uniref:Tetraacyldisaccharide 4'-kinase n=1 Tax=Flavobacterium nakdongensis TaxID=3073563 RepID=A0ABY9RBY9_9FLAO|nr:tetraacyldisaccharide 4'-kinase [Flavobacterium sp. 20NA77.7]WMW78343.1 tetraacyldisaccharide 4'-kinase [Flavobacterium sp. 20NA77.7]